MLVTGSNKKWHPLLIVICLLDAAISLVIMRVILAIMGIRQILTILTLFMFFMREKSSLFC